MSRLTSQNTPAPGAEELGVELDEHIAFVRDAMAGIAAKLELPPAE